jgi:hypothetical protein
MKKMIKVILKGYTEGWRLERVKITKKQRNLMLYSQIIHEYPWLYQLLINHEKIDLEVVPVEFHNEFQFVVPYILKQCAEEWKGSEQVLHPIEDLGDDRKPCSLCGTPNRYIYYIQNRLNGNTLNVGSDCVEEFVDIDFLKDGKSKGQLLREAKKIRRRTIINKHIPGIEKTINTWESQLTQYHVLIPLSIEQPYMKAGNTLRDLYEGYLEEKYDETIFTEISQLISKKQTFVSEMEAYQQMYIGDKLIATPKMASWLERFGDLQTLSWLKEDGRVTSRSISRILEPSFIETILPDVSDLFDQIQIELADLDLENMAYILIPRMFQDGRIPIKLFCKVQKILDYYGVTLFGGKSRFAFDLNNIVKISDIYDEKSHDRLIEELKEVTKQSSVGISIHQDYYSMQEIDLIDKHTNLILPFDLKTFIQEFKGLAFRLPKPTLYDLEQYVKQLPGRRYTRKELNDIRNVRDKLR